MAGHDASDARRGPSRRRATTAAAGLLALLAAGTAQARVRVAVEELRVEGDAAPALQLQLQDGFILGLVREGAHVMDPGDVERRLADTPELRGCETSPCLKRMGAVLEAHYVVRVRVDVAGNSYRMLARVFATEGAVPAALPAATQSKSCDVCTIAEARDTMIRLAEALRPDIEEPLPPARPTAALPATPASRDGVPARPLLVAMGGALVAAAGVAVLVTAGQCDAMKAGDCSEHRARSAFAGALIGAGLVGAGVAGYVALARWRDGGAPAATMASLGVRW